MPIAPGNSRGRKAKDKENRNKVAQNRSKNSKKHPKPPQTPDSRPSPSTSPALEPQQFPILEDLPPLPDSISSTPSASVLIPGQSNLPSPEPSTLTPPYQEYLDQEDDSESE